VATVEVGMATWKAIRSRSATKDPSIQSKIELDFRKEWLHRSILGKGSATIRWHFLPPLYYSNLLNEWRGCCLPPCLGFTLFDVSRDSKSTVTMSYNFVSMYHV
jgi:hypothetical protein